MRNLALSCLYDGNAFHGWQRQKNSHTVQAELEDTWQSLFKEKISLQGSSRTDTGVSALAHVSNFTTKVKIAPANLVKALNSRLSEAVAVRACQEVDLDFHSQYLAFAKSYVYTLFLDPIRPVLARSFTSHYPRAIKLSKLKAAAKIIEANTYCQALMDQGSPVKSYERKIDLIDFKLKASPEGGAKSQILEIRVHGRGFLYHMVRIIIGTLLYYNEGKLSLAELSHYLDLGDRTKLGKTMPAQGLCLEQVYYQKAIFGEDSQADYLRIIKEGQNAK